MRLALRLIQLGGDPAHDPAEATVPSLLVEAAANLRKNFIDGIDNSLHDIIVLMYSSF